MEQYIPLLQTGFVAVATGVITYMGVRAKNKADALKITADATLSEESRTDVIIKRHEKENERLERDNGKLLQAITAKDLTIANLTGKLLEHKNTEEVYLHQIQILNRKVDELGQKVLLLSYKINGDEHPTHS